MGLINSTLRGKCDPELGTMPPKGALDASIYAKKCESVGVNQVATNGSTSEFAVVDEPCKDKEKVQQGVNRTFGTSQSLSQDQQSDEEVASTRSVVVSNQGDKSKYASVDLQAERKKVLREVAQSGFALRNTSTAFHGDKEVVMRAVDHRFGDALECASPELRGDNDVVKLAVSRCGRVLQHASRELREDVDVVKAAISSNAAAFQFASPKIRSNPKIAMAAVWRWGYCLEYVSPELRDDVNIVMLAVTEAPTAFRFASKRLRGDKQVAMVVVQKAGSMLQYASAALRSDPEVVLAALANFPDALFHVSNRYALSRDLKFVAQAMPYIKVSSTTRTSSQLFAKRLAPFPGLARRLYTLLQGMIDLSISFDTKISPECFTEDWEERLWVTQLSLSIAFPNVSHHIFEFHGLQRQRELVESFRLYAPVVRSLLRGSRGDDGWMCDIPRFISWFDKNSMYYTEDR